MSKQVHGVKTWFSDKVEIRKSPIEGLGLFCAKPIKKDEILSIKGGHIIGSKEFKNLPEICKHAALQIAQHMYVAPFTEAEIVQVMTYVNHSCNPNVGLTGHLATTAMRDVEPGEELTGDYCVAYSNDFFEFDCNCCSTDCRLMVKSDDWTDKSLQSRYQGYFAMYTQEKIDLHQMQ